ncbi:hypothetical protein VCRA213O314_760017 [Vibrio crassostreae]|nr:hypothetical protein VCRA213O314_760017 [Vibrio crassostreae]
MINVFSSLISLRFAISVNETTISKDRMDKKTRLIREVLIFIGGHQSKTI